MYNDMILPLIRSIEFTFTSFVTDRKGRLILQTAFALCEVFGNIYSIVILLSDADNDGAVFLL